MKVPEKIQLKIMKKIAQIIIKLQNGSSNTKQNINLNFRIKIIIFTIKIIIYIYNE